MCGIAGFIDFKHHSTEEQLRKMTDTLVHRGPDGAGYQVNEMGGVQIGLGHRRLSIIDLSETGKQPMNFGPYWISFNGEIYNYAEIKAELSQKGHQFIGHSDTEMILHAYAEWGRKCIDRFIGMFAFVLTDAEKQEVFCVRDRAGIKPFFYYEHEGLFLFASELKAFHAHPLFKKEINTAAVAAFMQYGHVPGAHCIFNHCHKLLPGHFLHFSLKNPVYNPVQYWNVYDAYNKPKLQISFQEALSETEKLLQSAFDYRMVADVPVGVFLSGGYDSTCVSALLQKNRSEKLKTYTIGVPDIGLNEAEYAKETAQILGTEHHEYYCSSAEALELIPDLPHFYDEPFADSSAIPTTLVCKIARQSVTVALSADAGDEVFAGYNRYDYLMKYGKKLRSIPGFVRKTGAGFMDMVPAEKVPYFNKKYNFPNRYEKLKGLLNDPSAKQMMLSLSREYTNEKLETLMLEKPEILKTLFLSNELRAEYYTPLSYMMAIDYQTYLPDDIMQKVDRASMSVSLEGREPFLDHRVIEWAAQLPDHFKYNNGIKKYILREIVHQYIPKEKMDRPKMGFAIPIGEWLTKELKTQVEYYLDENRISAQGLFNPAYVSDLKRQFFAGKKELTNKIWYMLMFQMWFEKWGE